MDEFIKIWLSLSVSGTLLFLLIFLLKPFYRKRLSKSWQYYIWLAAALRFLLPFTPQASLIGYVAENVETAAAEYQEYALNGGAESAQNSSLPADIENGGRFNRTAGMEGAEETERTKTAEDDERAGGGTVSPYNLLFYIWSAAALALFIRKITIYQNFVRYLNAANMEVTDMETLNLLAECEEKLKIRKPVGLSRNPLIASPIMTGLKHPEIILPMQEMKEEEMAYVFRHELIHYKRHDMLYKWFFQLLVCLHWFNPFVYLMGKEISKACELSCDEAVIGPLDERERRVYGDMLLSFVKKNSAYKSALASVTLTEGAGQLKERLGAIMEFKKKSKAVYLIAAAFTIIIVFGAAALGAYAVPKGGKESLAAERQEKQSSVPYLTYMRNGFYYGSHVFDMGWNISSSEAVNYDSVTIALEDGKDIRVYFDDSAEEYMTEEEALLDLASLLFSLNGNPDFIKVETPCIMQIWTVDKEHPEASAAEFYAQDELLPFSVLFPELGEEAQKDYLEEIYGRDQIAYFSSTIKNMDTETISLYADKAQQERKIAFFSVCREYLPSEEMSRYAAKYYEANDIAGFSVTVSDLTQEEKREFLEKAKEDNRLSFISVLSSGLED